MSDDASVPADHPRADSLAARERLADGIDRGLTHREGLIAHGRGEAFDYLLGEETIPSADRAARAAAAHLLLADHPVVSVNGNVAALAPEAMVALADAAEAALEVNLFHRDEQRLAAIADHLRDHGAEEVLGERGDGEVPGLSHGRATVDSEGIGAADVVFVPLEDGDRTAALEAQGVTTIVVDLNPRSRSARDASIPIVDALRRAVPRVTDHVGDLRGADRETLRGILADFDATEARADAESRLREGKWNGASERAEREVGET
jgi:4-phosphopantoate--beta-alanine ligase